MHPSPRFRDRVLVSLSPRSASQRQHRGTPAADGVTIGGMATGDDITELLAAAEDELAEAGFRTGDFARVRELLAEARAQTEQAGDLTGQARALDLLGMVAHYDNITKLMRGDNVPAQEIDAEERLFRQALAAWHAADQRPSTAQALFGLGLVYQVLHSDWPSAMPYFWQALELVAVDDADTTLYLRSEVHRHVGFYFLAAAEQPAEAVRHLQLSLDFREQLGDPRRIPSGQVALAQAELAAGDRDRAIELLRAAVVQAREAGLLAERIEDAERALREAEAAADAGTEDRDATGRSDSNAVG
jgi:tetratricopeptide (TPR) repeat protein